MYVFKKRTVLNVIFLLYFIIKHSAQTIHAQNVELMQFIRIKYTNKVQIKMADCKYTQKEVQ